MMGDEMSQLELAPQEMDQAIQEAFRLASTQHQSGKLKQAEELYQAILQLAPGHAEANYQLGMLALAAARDTSPQLMLNALNSDPSQGRYWMGYVEALNQVGQIESAKQILAQARHNGLSGEEVDRLEARLWTQRIATGVKDKNPSQKEVKVLMATIDSGQLDHALELACMMTKQCPRYGFGWVAQGLVLNMLGRNREAADAMRTSIILLPNDAQAHGNLGVVLHALGRYEEAERSMRRAVKLKSDYPKAHNNLGAILQELGRLSEAEACYRKALKIKPDMHDAHSNLGNTLRLLWRLNEAEQSYLTALKFAPMNAFIHFNLGATLHDLGRIEEAETSYRRALELDPTQSDAFSNLLYCLSQSSHLDAHELFMEHRRFGETFEVSVQSERIPHTNQRDLERVLQIGFVSGDLNNHAIANFIEPLLVYLAKSQRLVLHAYANHAVDDQVSQRLRQYFAHWTPVIALNEAELAEQIRRDGIDILVDLSGHTHRNRLMTFARKPAPLQVTWMGYPGTTGLSAMDYYFSDACFLPAGSFDDQFTEKIVHLPASAPFLPSQDAPPVNSLPSLQNGFVTFGSFNRLSKISPMVVAVWTQLMNALPQSRIVIGGVHDVNKCTDLIAWFAQGGVSRDRIDLHQRGDMRAYLSLHHQVDICLDTFPYSGGTTTLHAVWMGVPTLTMSGATTAGQTSASAMVHVGLEAWVAYGVDDFVKKGVRLGADLAELSKLRSELRHRFTQCAMGQPQLIAAGLEEAFRVMWQRWCDGLPPTPFEASGKAIITNELEMAT